MVTSQYSKAGREIEPPARVLGNFPDRRGQNRQVTEIPVFAGSSAKLSTWPIDESLSDEHVLRDPMKSIG